MKCLRADGRASLAAEDFKGELIGDLIRQSSMEPDLAPNVMLAVLWAALSNSVPATVLVDGVPAAARAPPPPGLCHGLPATSAARWRHISRNLSRPGVPRSGVQPKITIGMLEQVAPAAAFWLFDL